MERFLVEGFIDPLPDGAGGALEDFGDLSGREIFFEDEAEGASPETFGIGFGHDRRKKGHRFQRGATRPIS